MKLFTSLLISGITAFSLLSAPATVNTSESTITWTAKKVTGQHHGKVPIESATLDYEGGKITGGEFTMDMTSLTVEDITDPGMNKKLSDHLKSDDFFAVEKHNKTKFVITEASSSNGKDYTITGDLTIKGITKPVSFPAKVEVDGTKITASGKLTFDRTHYDIKFRSGSYFENLADKMIYDDVELDVNLVASTQ
ncbi:YceI family protein [Algoriphagus halophytocola]|uniref:YceI family protein n=1 Tax=Algoriphagus halophytocola TaxID=2991499 RepID=A0ABY6MK20_9BACT|nr:MULTISPECIES: YceI family protein [unclassified Algoriphagus]UZD22762.1 YceI family protein [Algoriphagus sp. TR-M5]WBL44027.1 YceI family protein [Algoriphagus sp. TR-M9]